MTPIEAAHVNLVETQTTPGGASPPGGPPLDNALLYAPHPQVGFLRRHQPFILLLVLFVAFRFLALWLLRPGGYLGDVSDYDFYMVWGEMGARGYRTFETLWSIYPPLFPALMLPLFEWASRIPPWFEPQLAFTVLFGSLLLLFESGNLLFIYRLAGKLVDEGAPPAGPLRAPLFYALLFAPFFTLLGWFEPMPLFFLLLGLDLLLNRAPGFWARGTWAGSAVAVALGFLTKLTPIVLLPVAVRWLGARLSWDAAQREWFNRRSPGNLLRPLIYVLTFLGTVAALGYWLVGGRLELAFTSLTLNTNRPPWQSIWALLEGYTGYGLVPLDQRNLQGLSRTLWEGWLPWTWITVGFLALYLWLYTRRYDWARPRTAVAFTGVSVIWLLLYSRGWSPQFLVWVLAFVVVLMPSARGVAVALALTFINVIESYIYLTLLPKETWILTGTVLLRTALLISLAAEFLGQIWPQPQALGLRRAARGASLAAAAAVVLFALVGAPRMAAAYGERRLAEIPCSEAITHLRAAAAEPGAPMKIATTEIELWRTFYPWLRTNYTMRVVDDYDANDRPAAIVRSERLRDFVGNDREFWWLNSLGETAATAAALPFFDDDNVHTIEAGDFGNCSLVRVVTLDPATQPPATVAVQGGPILLRGWKLGDARPGASLPLVLYWQADTSVAESYTVFTQLLDASGAIVAQQDNPPVQGQVPTETWTPGTLVRDPYLLDLPANLPTGRYRLLIGMYNTQGQRAAITQGDATSDALTIDVAVASP
jgi:hypothetical protein